MENWIEPWKDEEKYKEELKRTIEKKVNEAIETIQREKIKELASGLSEPKDDNKTMMLFYVPNSETYHLFLKIYKRGYWSLGVNDWYITDEEFRILFPNSICPFKKYTIQQVKPYFLSTSSDQAVFIFVVKRYMGD